MAILNVQLSQVGLVGVSPGTAYILTNDTIAEVTTAGYLNAWQNASGGLTEATACLVATKTSEGATSTEVGWFDVSYNTSTKNWSLTSMGEAGSVTLPTIANHLAVFTNATGAIGEDVATAINGGNIQAGLSGTAGYFASFPATLARGSLRLVGANSAGDTVTQITNASQAAARTFTIPDGGQSASSFLLTDNAATQTIATGSLALTLGNITAAAGNIAATLGSLAAGTTVTAGTGITATTGSIVATAGSLIGGASAGGTAGGVTLYPATASNGSLVLAPVGNVGNFASTISNVVGLGQASVYTLPDPANAVARILVGATATPFTTGRLLSSSGTGGLVADSGIATSAVQLSANIKAGTAAITGGSATEVVTIAGLTAASVIVCTVEASTTVGAYVISATAGTGNATVTFNADPGSSTLNYVAFVVSQ